MNTIKLPEPNHDSKISVETALYKRRSIRDLKSTPLHLKEISMLLWAAQGVTALGGYRTTPSAGAMFPLEAYLVVGNVDDLAAGVYHYNPREHQIAKVDEHDRRAELSEASLDQTWMQNGAVMIVLTGIKERTTATFGNHWSSFVLMEAGHAAQNVYLQSFALGLGMTAVGSFDEKKVKSILKLKEGEAPLYLMPIGHK
ncbi:MAG: nitroreductase [Lentisphaerae bacterium GWF2_57_35]|nr:MAG: nitroreductase [Lentisphaerae bacterium GWF2_57_35]